MYVFSDGSSITALTGAAPNEETGIVNAFYLEMDYDTNGYKKPNVIGKDIFHFVFAIRADDKYSFMHCSTCIKNETNCVNSRSPRDELLDACKSKPSTCSCLLMSDGWEFKEDYPW